MILVNNNIYMGLRGALEFFLVKVGILKKDTRQKTLDLPPVLPVIP